MADICCWPCMVPNPPAKPEQTKPGPSTAANRSFTQMVNTSCEVQPVNDKVNETVNNIDTTKNNIDTATPENSPTLQEVVAESQGADATKVNKVSSPRDQLQGSAYNMPLLGVTDEIMQGNVNGAAPILQRTDELVEVETINESDDEQNIILVPETQLTKVVNDEEFDAVVQKDLQVVKQIWHLIRAQHIPNLWGLWSTEVALVPFFVSSQCIAFEYSYNNAKSQYVGPWLFHNSDHHPLLVSQDLSGVKHPAPFHFFRAWTSHADCVRVVKEVWAEPVHGSPMVCLQAKLKRLKAALKEWNLTVFGNMDHNVTSAIDEVNSVQALIDEIGITDALQQRDFEAQLALSKVLLQQEIFWREKARVNNFSFGDRNTAYFHSANSLIQDCIPDLVSTEDNNFLTSTPSDAEIKLAIFSMNGDGAPGPDGFGGHFYQHFWDIMASDEILHSARLSVLVNGKLAGFFP
ncbi:hypothetical protein QL285_078023 [Trifolium repens]|nr:hypothetical protein QL285_078023 [Trifolium repens]